MPVIDLHFVSWNRPKITRLVIKAIHRNTKPENFRLVVFDNGSNPETLEMLTELHNNGFIDELHCMSTNEGLESARQWLFNNTVMSNTQSDYFICVDNDCIPPPMENGLDWIDRLVDLMDRYEDFAAISCRTQVMIGTGNIFEEADQVGDDLVEFPHPGGSLRIMKINAVGQAGAWSPITPGRGTEERKIGGRLHALGYRTAFAAKIPCLHLFGLPDTDRWGYDKNWEPEDTGHSDISHPALTNGDDIEEVKKFAGRELADAYRHN